MANGFDQIRIQFDNGEEELFFKDTQVRNILKKHKEYSDNDAFLGALVNNTVVSLTYPVEVDSTVKPLTIENSHGWRIYRDSVAFVLTKAVFELFPQYKLEIRHSLESGYYCTLDGVEENIQITDLLLKIEFYMHQMVSEKIPIVRKNLYLADALYHFASRLREDKCDLLRFQNPSKVPVYQCGNFLDLAHGVLTDNTKILSDFRIFKYENGFILQFPDREAPHKFSTFKGSKSLFNIFKSYKEWGKTINLKTVGHLNEIIVRGKYEELIEIEEAYQEKRIAEIADKVAEKKETLKWVLISGPSSSGKTTFAHRLSTQIKVNGIMPIIVSVDNYFVDRHLTPLDEHGNYDFEHIDTIDLPLLHEHLSLLDKGETIEPPVFDFTEGKKYKSGKKLCLKDNQIAIIEGIHSLNPRMTETLHPDRKFCIYINALTQLNLDLNTRISTTDNRLIRRIVRDHRTRGNRALATLKMWPSVRNGEKKWIFPFQHNANCAFSSAQNYELAVLKPFVEPLLAEIKPWHEQYADAQRLQEFLRIFSTAPVTPIPYHSLVREFVGGGILG